MNGLLSKYYKEETESTSFSSLKKDDDIIRMLKELTVNYDLKEGKLSEKRFEKLFDFLSECNNAINHHVYSESTLTRMIFYILVVVCIEVQANISLEERVRGKQVHANGAFEFLIRHGNVMCCVAECYY